MIIQGSVIELFRLQDRDVSQKLQDRLRSLNGLVLVSGVKHGRHMRPVEEREPFLSIEDRFGQWLSWLVVVEEESNQIAWRDPLGDLGAHVFPTDRSQAYAAATGYLLLKDGEVEDVIRKQGAAEKDLWNIQEALAAAHPEIPRPGQTSKRSSGKHRTAPPEPPQASSSRPSRPRPAVQDPEPSEPPPASSRPSRPRPAIYEPEAFEPTPPLGRRATGEWDLREEVTPLPVADPDPWAVLGVAPGTPVAEVRKAFRAMMVQYHPDKVAHLAPEFRELADKKSRQITEAWEKIRSDSGEQADE